MKPTLVYPPDNLAFYRELVDNVPACIYINELFFIDGKPELRNTWSNTFAHKFIGYSRDEIDQMGSAFFTVILHPDDLQMIDCSNIDKSLTEGKLFNLQRLKPRNSATYRWLYGYSTVIGWSDDGMPQKFLNIAIEIDKQIGTESQLYGFIKEANQFRYQLLVEKLTNRQKEILRLIASGKRDKEIAGQLFISPATAKTHRNQLLKKLNLKNTATLAAFAVECGL